MSGWSSNSGGEVEQQEPSAPACKPKHVRSAGTRAACQHAPSCMTPSRYFGGASRTLLLAPIRTFNDRSWQRSRRQSSPRAIQYSTRLQGFLYMASSTSQQSGYLAHAQSHCRISGRYKRARLLLVPPGRLFHLAPLAPPEARLLSISYREAAIGPRYPMLSPCAGFMRMPRKKRWKASNPE